MQLIAGDGRAFGDVAQRNFDVELGQRVLHQPGVGHQFLLRFGRLDILIGELKEIHRTEAGNFLSWEGAATDIGFFFTGGASSPRTKYCPTPLGLPADRSRVHYFGLLRLRYPVEAL